MIAQIIQLLRSGPHMAITAAAAWALYAATQENRPVVLAAYSSGALQPLLDLIQGGGSHACLSLPPDFAAAQCVHTAMLMKEEIWCRLRWKEP